MRRLYRAIRIRDSDLKRTFGILGMGSNKKFGHTTSRMRCAVASISLVFGVGGLLTLTAEMQIGCSRAASQQRTPTLELASASFSGETIPKSCSSCKGQDGASPELSWKAPPEGTQSFALIV